MVDSAFLSLTIGGVELTEDGVELGDVGKLIPDDDKDIHHDHCKPIPDPTPSQTIGKS